MNLPAPNKRNFQYKWLILGLCFSMVFICLGFCSGNKGLYLAAITEALDIKRSLFSINDSCRYVSTAVINLFFGSLIARLGAKKLIGAGFMCLIISSLLYAIADNVFVFYIGGCFLGAGLAWTTTTMVSFIVSMWFTKNRGTIMGFVLAANGLGGALAAQIISPIIYEEGNTFGYRNAYLLTAVILLAAGALIFVFMKNYPPAGQQEEVQNKKANSGIWVGLEFNQVAKNAYFAVAAVCVFFTGMAMQSVTGVAAAHMRDVGMDTGYVANIMSIHAIALALFKFLTGILYDKIGLRITMIICDIAAIVNIFILAALTNTPAGRLLAVIYGIFISLALPLETTIIPFVTFELFGEKSYAKALGVLVSINTAGYALGTPVTNLVFDGYGTYQPMFFILGGVMAVVTVAFQFVLKKAKNIRLINE